MNEFVQGGGLVLAIWVIGFTTGAIAKMIFYGGLTD